jgi:hypothetical protein
MEESEVALLLEELMPPDALLVALTPSFLPM